MKRSKISSSLVVLVVTSSLLMNGTPKVEAARYKEVSIFVNNIKLPKSGYSVPSSGGNNRVLVPLRVVSESLGANVHYIAEPEEMAIVMGDDVIIRNQIGTNKAWVNGQSVTLDVAAQKLEQGTTYVPLRFAFESLGTKSSDIRYESGLFKDEVHITNPPNHGNDNFEFGDKNLYFGTGQYRLTGKWETAYFDDVNRPGLGDEGFVPPTSGGSGIPVIPPGPPKGGSGPCPTSVGIKGQINSIATGCTPPPSDPTPPPGPPKGITPQPMTATDEQVKYAFSQGLQKLSTDNDVPGDVAILDLAAWANWKLFIEPRVVKVTRETDPYKFVRRTELIQGECVGPGGSEETIKFVDETTIKNTYQGSLEKIPLKIMEGKLGFSLEKSEKSSYERTVKVEPNQRKELWKIEVYRPVYVDVKVYYTKKISLSPLPIPVPTYDSFTYRFTAYQFLTRDHSVETMPWNAVQCGVSY